MVFPREHLAVDRADLMWERVEVRRVDSEVRVEQVREADAERLGSEAEELAVSIEAPGPPLALDL